MRTRLDIRRLVVCSVFILACTTGIKSQVTYNYDASGNRIKRYVLLKSATVTSEQDSLSGQAKQEVYEETLGSTEVHIYPNPTHGELEVEITGQDPSVAAIEYCLYAQTGHLLERKQGLTGSFSINLGRYSSGMYVLKLQIAGKVSEWKIIKE